MVSFAVIAYADSDVEPGQSDILKSITTNKTNQQTTHNKNTPNKHETHHTTQHNKHIYTYKQLITSKHICICKTNTSHTSTDTTTQPHKTPNIKPKKHFWIEQQKRNNKPSNRHKPHVCIRIRSRLIHRICFTEYGQSRRPQKRQTPSRRTPNTNQ